MLDNQLRTIRSSPLRPLPGQAPSSVISFHQSYRHRLLSVMEDPSCSINCLKHIGRRHHRFGRRKGGTAWTGTQQTAEFMIVQRWSNSTDWANDFPGMWAANACIALDSSSRRSRRRLRNDRCTEVARTNRPGDDHAGKLIVSATSSVDDVTSDVERLKPADGGPLLIDQRLGRFRYGSDRIPPCGCDALASRDTSEVAH